MDVESFADSIVRKELLFKIIAKKNIEVSNDILRLNFRANSLNLDYDFVYNFDYESIEEIRLLASRSISAEVDLYLTIYKDVYSMRDHETLIEIVYRLYF